MKDKQAWVPVRNGYLGVSDKIAALLGKQDDVNRARYRIRDEARRITWVNDRMYGFVPEGGE